MPQFNKAQSEAIETRDASILVSAPAGSGKTRILVSRIVDLLIKDHYEIDQFLVLTFTEAAGNEMKQRLNIDLHEKLEDPAYDALTKAHIEKQLLKLPNAYITNFHGFCSTLLKKYGYLVNVMPGFEINSAPASMQAEVLDSCIEEWIREEPFRDYLSRYFTKYSFEDFKTTIISYCNVSSSYVDFFDFIDTCHSKYYEFEEIEDWPLFAYLKEIMAIECKKAMNRLEALSRYCETQGLTTFFGDEEKPEKISIYQAHYDYLEERIKALQGPLTYDTFVSLMNGKVEKSLNMSWSDIDDDIKKTYNAMKKKILDPLNKRIKDLMSHNIDDLKEILDFSYRDIAYLLGKGGLLDCFMQAYALAKRERNQLDFSDLERFTTQLLSPEYPIVSLLHNQLKEIMVDEYQDTNQIQENLIQSIATLASPEIPLFMVGDMKQSIYRFRQADPAIFKSKFDTFEKEAGHQTKRIDLLYNYRSEKVVLDSINFIFNQIMDPEVGGLEYYTDESARLNYDFVAKKTTLEELEKDRSHDTEVLIDLYDSNGPFSKEEMEAHMVAQRIVSLIEESQGTITYCDIAILMSTATNFVTYKKIFDRYHIPANVTLADGLFKANEVLSLLTLLKSLVHPEDDIALLSVLHNDFLFSHFGENMLLALRDENHSLYENLKASSQEQVIHFLEVFESLRTYAANHTPYEALIACLKETGYQTFVSTLINGAQRSANIDMLVDVFRSQSDYSYLDDYLKAIDQGMTIAPGTVTSDDNNAVTFMTIHKSKGLQFKVVFVSNLQRAFSTEDAKAAILLDRTMGVAMKPKAYRSVGDYDHVLCEYENEYKKLISYHIQSESIDEQMRLLYVALTRAVSKLILTGVYKSMDEIAPLAQAVEANDGDSSRSSQDTVLFNLDLRTTNNFLDWIMMGIMRHPDVIETTRSIPELAPYITKLSPRRYPGLFNEATQLAHFQLSFHHDEDIVTAIPDLHRIEAINHYEDYREAYDFVYPYEDQLRSIAVTTLQALDEEKHFDVRFEADPAGMKATDKGTLVHNVLSMLTFKGDDIETLIANLDAKQLFTEEEKDTLIHYQDHLDTFIQSETYQLISQAEEIYQEKPFRYKEKDGRLINGIFDLVFKVKDKVYVLDYKTDRIAKNNTEEQLVALHKVQLDYYKKVLKHYYGVEVTGIIYYLHNGKAVQC